MGSLFRHWLQNKSPLKHLFFGQNNTLKLPITQLKHHPTFPQPYPIANPYPFPTFPQPFSTAQNPIAKPQPNPPLLRISEIPPPKTTSDFRNGLQSQQNPTPKQQSNPHTQNTQSPTFLHDISKQNPTFTYSISPTGGTSNYPGTESQYPSIGNKHHES